MKKIMISLVMILLLSSAVWGAGLDRYPYDWEMEGNVCYDPQNPDHAFLVHKIYDDPYDPRRSVYSRYYNYNGNIWEAEKWLSIGDTTVVVQLREGVDIYVHPRIKQILNNEKELVAIRKENKELKEYTENLKYLIELLVKEK